MTTTKVTLDFECDRSSMLTYYREWEKSGVITRDQHEKLRGRLLDSVPHDEDGTQYVSIPVESLRDVVKFTNLIAGRITTDLCLRTVVSQDGAKFYSAIALDEVYQANVVRDVPAETAALADGLRRVLDVAHEALSGVKVP